MADTIMLAAVGDICISGPIREAIRSHGPLWPFERIRDALRADLVFGNLECTAYRPGEPEPESRLRMCMPWTDGQGLKDAGFSVLNLANNHILDCGGQIGLQTAGFCEQYGLAHVGFGPDQAQARKPVVLEREGIRVGFLAYTEDCPGLKRQVEPGPAYLSEPNILEDIDGLKDAGADVVVVSLHADVEFVDHPAPHRVAMSRRLIDAGADVLLEHHPHVTQGIERHAGGLIAYSLGNCVFPLGDYQRKGSEWTAKSFVLRIELGKEGYRSHEIVPFQLEDGRPVPMSGEAEKVFLERQDRISADLADPAALERAWLETARRYVRINIGWLAEALAKKGIDHAATEFLQRLFYDENLPWLARAIEDLIAELPPRKWETTDQKSSE